MNPMIPDEGIRNFAGIISNAIMSGSHGCVVHLFDNNYTPTKATVLADLNEATFAGGGSQPMPAGVDNGIIPGNIDQWLFDPMTWTALGAGLPVVIFGYWVDCINPITVARQLLWVKRFDAPQALTFGGEVLKVRLTLGTVQG